MRSGHPLASCLALLLALGACSPASADRLAEARRLADQQDYAGAILLLKSVIQEEPTLARARWMLGAALSLGQPLPDVVPLQARALLAAGKPQAVIAQFGSLALADAQPTAALRTAVAQAQATLGDWPAARDSLAQALRAVPGHEAAMLLSARLASVSGDAAGALKWVDDLLAADAGSADAWLLKGDPFMRLNLARFYAQAGEKRKAKAEFDRLEALGERFAKQGEVAALSKGLGGR